MVEQFAEITAPVLPCQLDARAFADTKPIVLTVLQLAESSGRRQIGPMPVLDACLLERCLQPQRVGPGVLWTAHTAALPDIHHLLDMMPAQLAEEVVEARVVDPDGRDGARVARAS